MKIFVTGASGFVGGAAARHLVARGHTVMAMARSERADMAVQQAGATPVRCDLESIAAQHISGADAVLHCAAYVEDWGPRDAWERFNVEGTRRMLEAARDAGVRRFIHIGSEAALVHGQHIDGADESYPLAPSSPYPYCATKARAEMLVVAANVSGFTTVVLRPRFIWGPGDTTLLPVLEQMAKTGQWRFIDGGRATTSTTHIDNLTHAIELALTSGRGGEAYFILDDGDTTMRAMLDGMAASRGLTLPNRSIPSWLAALVAGLGEALWRTLNLKGKPPLTRHAAMVMARRCTLVGSKAARELGYNPIVSREEGLRSLSSGDAPS